MELSLIVLIKLKASLNFTSNLKEQNKKQVLMILYIYIGPALRKGIAKLILRKFTIQYYSNSLFFPLKPGKSPRCGGASSISTFGTFVNYTLLVFPSTLSKLASLISCFVTCNSRQYFRG